MSAKTFWTTALALVSLLAASVACAANAINMRVNGVPQYICPSATPQPTSPPNYPGSFLANLDYAWVDPIRNVVQVDYVAQNAGTIQVSYSGSNYDGTRWFGAIVFGTLVNRPRFPRLSTLTIPPP